MGRMVQHVGGQTVECGRPRPAKIMIAGAHLPLPLLQRADHRGWLANANAAASAIDIKIIATLYRKHAPLLLTPPHFYSCGKATASKGTQSPF